MSQDDTLLGPYRVLDLANERGMLCGKIFGDMGADVIKVEPPAGDPVRRQAPFYENQPDPERSLLWWAMNTNKRGVTLDIEQAEGRALLLKLVKSAHFLVESFHPGYLDSLGLGYAALREANPALVFISITPYGSTGPRADWAATDFNVQATGTNMYLSGDADRAPVSMAVPAAYLHGGAEGAAAGMIAHRHRQRTGRGQHVDVSMQQCLVWTLLNTTMSWQLLGRQEMRGGAVRRERGNTIFTRVMWPCKDGCVLFIPIGGGGGSRRVKSFFKFLDWMRDEGFPAEVADRDWAGLQVDIGQEEYNAIAEKMLRFLATRTVAELYERAARDNLLIAPISKVSDLFDSAQLQARDFFVELPHPELGRSFRYAGPFARFSATPVGPTRRAPLLGEHNAEVYAALGYSHGDLDGLRARKVI